LGQALCYIFETVALNSYSEEYGFEDLYIPLRDRRNQEIKQGLQAVGQAFLNGSGPERVEVLLQFAADFYVPGKAIHALGSVLGVLQSFTKIESCAEAVAVVAGETNQVVADVAQVAAKLEQTVTEQVVQETAQKFFRTTKKQKHPKKLARAAIEGSTGKPTQPRTIQQKAKDALEKAQNLAKETRTMPDGRVRYYSKEDPCHAPGSTRGRSHVTEYDPKTNRIRQWSECRDHFGNVNRVRPKMINGQQIKSLHYPHTKQELELLAKQFIAKGL
jgi:hypothetical protein